MNIKKNTKFKLNNQEVITTRDVQIDSQDKGYFILNMWTQCGVADINVLEENINDSIEEKMNEHLGEK